MWRLESGSTSVAARTLAPNSSPAAWPASPQEFPLLRCRNHSATYPAFSRISSYRPDRQIETAWLAWPGKIDPKNALVAEPAPGYVFPFQKGWIRREDEGRLLQVSGRTQKQIASERCGGRILHADEATGLFLVACEEYRPVLTKRSTAKKRKSKPKYRFDLYLIRPGLVRSLKADTARTGVDVPGEQHSPFASLRPGREAALVDFKRLKLHHLESSSYVLATGQSQALIRKNDELYTWSPGSLEKLSFPISPLSRLLQNEAALAIDTRVFLLSSKLATWELPSPPLALSPLGYSLSPAEGETGQKWAEGPLILLGPPQTESTSHASTTTDP